jgi:hypothetical protein
MLMTGSARVASAEDGPEPLDEEECLALLATSGVGRVGVSIAALPAIFPVNFVLRGREIVFKTAEGTRLSTAARHSVVAFQCDAVDPQLRSGWSVLVVGRAVPVRDTGSIQELDRLGLEPWAAGDRSYYIRVPADEVSGRRMSHIESRPTFTGPLAFP